MKKKLLYTIPVLSLLLLAGTALAAFYPSGGGTYRLQSSIGSADTTINLSSFAEPVSGIPYTMSYLNSSIECGTLDPQTSKSEFISFTGITQNSNGTAQLTGVLRGLGRSYPYTASTTLASSHAGQSIFILSDAPCLFNNYAAITNTENITGSWTIIDPTTPTSVANKEYVDGKVLGGIGNASETATGTVQIATAAQTAAGTTNGNLGRLVIPASLATTSNDVAGNHSVVTLSTGFINPVIINNLSTTTLVGNFNPLYQLGLQRFISTSTGTSTFSVPSGVTKFRVQVIGPGGNGGNTNTCSGSSLAASGGGSGGYSEKIVDLTGSSTVQYFIGAAAGVWTNFGTNGFFLSATGGATGSSGFNMGGLSGVGTNGDITASGTPAGAGFTGATNQTVGVSGYGGSGPFGGGGPSVTGDGNGVAATGMGSGGGGAYCNNNSGTHTGGAGSSGGLIISW